MSASPPHGASGSRSPSKVATGSPTKQDSPAGEEEVMKADTSQSLADVLFGSDDEEEAKAGKGAVKTSDEDAGEEPVTNGRVTSGKGKLSSDSDEDVKDVKPSMRSAKKKKNSTPRRASSSGQNADEAGPSSRSRSPSPAPTLAPPKKKKGGRNNRPVKSEPQLVTDLPRAEKEALSTFEELGHNWYQNSKLGRSRGQEECMVCECSFRFGIDDPGQACGEDSDCINRLTQVECLESECRCRHHCQNQRFQRRQYAPVEIVKTEKKGFGLRAGASLTTETFIYEYVGEVINHSTFLRRMQQYKDEGIRHFYFMMLQRDEYLDATKKGGKGRFVNHSCNPNCFVAKWHVGKHMRMGIFAKRDIVEGEELTFNYNVDRYGNDAQECFCGEPNCVGTIGGKTQTDIGGMDDLFLDALGIADEVEQLEAKGTKKKKSKHLDEDFTPLLRPIEEDEVPKVVTAVRQSTSNRRILQKLLNRIHMTEDVSVQKRLVKMHGFILMAGVLEEWKDDKEVLMLAMGSLARWPLIARNKLTDAGVEQPVKDLCSNQDDEIASLASELVSAWDALETSYRIARRAEEDAKASDPFDHLPPAFRRRAELDEMTLDTAEAPNAVSAQLDRIVPLGTAKLPRPTRRDDVEPLGGDSWRPGQDELRRGKHDDSWRPSKEDSWRRGMERDKARILDRERDWAPSTPQTPDGASLPMAMLAPPKPAAPPPTLEEIIRKAAEADARQRQEAAAAAAARASAAEREARKQHRSSSNGHGQGHAEKKRKSASSAGAGAGDAGALEKRLHKLVGELVVRCMSKHKDRLDREVFKKHAKELTSLVCQKEMKSKHWPPSSGLLEELSKDKRTKIKAFANEYIGKLIARKGLPAAGAARGSGSAPGSSAASASNAANGSMSPGDSNAHHGAANGTEVGGGEDSGSEMGMDVGADANANPSPDGASSPFPATAPPAEP